MAGKRKSFLSYDLARTFVIALALTSMQDWIAYAKGEDKQGRLRPDNIPSNPWTVYKDELAEQGLKFSINEFIGCKLPRKTRTPKASKADKPVKPKTQKAPKADAVSKTPFQIAKDAIQELNLPNREAFYALKRENKLPAGVPRKPDDAFKGEWQGWGDFLGNGNKQVAKTADA